ncbi:hypothetical protein RRF57_004299 [Xylaria bambusicola]|uniref:Uncharacterized protein n=1 Tax=Xylaria bambusicola TaxID=326684 RepID=A0AAN7UHR3_9PEZI
MPMSNSLNKWWDSGGIIEAGLGSYSSRQGRSLSQSLSQDLSLVPSLSWECWKNGKLGSTKARDTAAGWTSEF